MPSMPILHSSHGRVRGAQVNANHFLTRGHFRTCSNLCQQRNRHEQNTEERRHLGRDSRGPGLPARGRRHSTRSSGGRGADREGAASVRGLGNLAASSTFLCFISHACFWSSCDLSWTPLSSKSCFSQHPYLCSGRRNFRSWHASIR